MCLPGITSVGSWILILHHTLGSLHKELCYWDRQTARPKQMSYLLGCFCHTESTSFLISNWLRETKNFDQRHMIKNILIWLKILLLITHALVFCMFHFFVVIAVILAMLWFIEFIARRDYVNHRPQPPALNSEEKEAHYVNWLSQEHAE